MVAAAAARIAPRNRGRGRGFQAAVPKPMSFAVSLASLFLALVAPAQAQTPQIQRSAPALPWDAARAEHLWNRAGFGADPRTIARTVALGAEAEIDELLQVDPWIEEPFYARLRSDGRAEDPTDSAELREKRRAMRRDDEQQVHDFLEWWVERMLRGEDPLLERMTLFWHGHFTSSFKEVKSSYEMIRQNQLFRRAGLGSFRELLRGLARDPALLVYLDNDANQKNRPNENFARELLELFTLGEGHYSEEDVREVARAFTGWGVKNGRFRVDPARHDDGPKRILGVEGNLDGDDVVDIVLAQPACAAHLAERLLAYFEGVEPAPERRERYARLLRDADYRIDRFLRALFLDPEFYRPEVLGQRVASPLDYLVGSARRLGIEPQGRSLSAAASLLGERLFFPPSVKGWEGSRAWIASAPPELPGQMAGLFLGLVRARDLSDGLAREDREAARAAGADEAPEAPEVDEESEGDEAGQAGDEPVKAARRRVPSELRTLAHVPRRPRMNLTQRLAECGASDDAALARALLDMALATPPSDELVGRVTARLAARRAELELAGVADLFQRPERGEPLLRELAYEILALPEARLH